MHTHMLVAHSYTHVHIHAHTRGQIHTCSYAHIHTHIGTHTHTDTYTHVHTYAPICVYRYTHICMHTGSYIHILTYIHTHINICTHTDTHTRPKAGLSHREAQGCSLGLCGGERGVWVWGCCACAVSFQNDLKPFSLPGTVLSQSHHLLTMHLTFAEVNCDTCPSPARTLRVWLGPPYFLPKALTTAPLLPPTPSAPSLFLSTLLCLLQC